MNKIKTSVKVTELTEVLGKHFQNKVNQARIKFIAHFIIALCKVQTVTFEKLAHAFESTAQSDASLRRIQRFMADYSLNSDWIAGFIFSLLPKKEKLMLSIDRTNWKFGKTDINILMLGVCYEGVAFPLLFSLLDKKGNSSTQERIDLIQRFIKLFGAPCIDALTADREFVGKEWIAYLNGQHIRYYIRIRENFKVYLPDKHRSIKVFWLFTALSVGECYIHPKIVEIKGNRCYVSGKKLKQGDFLILISFNRTDRALSHYKERWSKQKQKVMQQRLKMTILILLKKAMNLGDEFGSKSNKISKSVDSNSAVDVLSVGTDVATYEAPKVDIVMRKSDGVAFRRVDGNTTHLTAPKYKPGKGYKFYEYTPKSK